MKQEHQFDKIVVAAGAWSNFLAKTIGDNFPLDTERGYHIIFENNNNLLTHPSRMGKNWFLYDSNGRWNQSCWNS